jgi:hypothetical protein
LRVQQAFGARLARAELQEAKQFAPPPRERVVVVEQVVVSREPQLAVAEQERVARKLAASEQERVVLAS